MGGGGCCTNTDLDLSKLPSVTNKFFPANQILQKSVVSWESKSRSKYQISHISEKKNNVDKSKMSLYTMYSKTPVDQKQSACFEAL